jgi:hypothetical protein
VLGATMRLSQNVCGVGLEWVLGGVGGSRVVVGAWGLRPGTGSSCGVEDRSGLVGVGEIATVPERSELRACVGGYATAAVVRCWWSLRMLPARWMNAHSLRTA